MVWCEPTCHKEMDHLSSSYSSTGSRYWS